MLLWRGRIHDRFVTLTMSLMHVIGNPSWDVYVFAILSFVLFRSRLTRIVSFKRLLSVREDNSSSKIASV